MPAAKSSVKRLLKRERAIKSGSSSECPSSDEGYVGSYSDSSHLIHEPRFIKSSPLIVKCAVVQEPVSLRIFDSPTSSPLSPTLLDSPDNLSDQVFLFTLSESLIDPIETELQSIKNSLDKQRNETDHQREEEMSRDWRLCLAKIGVEKKTLKVRIEEDNLDLDAYLLEIDMNLALFENELEDYSAPSLLGFACREKAFDLRAHNRLLSQPAPILTRTLFANIDAIPEFVPFMFETTHDTQALSFENVMEDYYLLDSQYQDQDEGFRDDQCHFDAAVVCQEDEQIYVEQYYDDQYYGEQYYDEQCYVDQYYVEQDQEEAQKDETQRDVNWINSLGYEDRIALLQSESEEYAKQTAKCGRVAEYNKCGKKKKKERRNSSGHSSSPDVSEGVFAYDDMENEFSPKTEDPLRNSLLKLMQKNRNMNKQQIDAENLRSSSNSSPRPSHGKPSLIKQALSNKPCVFKLNDGDCNRPECRFAHEFKAITCKYWLEGECLKGDACEFLHQVVEVKASSAASKPSKKKSSKSNNKKDLKQIDFKLETEEFPELGGGESNNIQASSIQQPATKNVAAFLFPQAPSVDIDSTSAKCVETKAIKSKPKKAAHKENAPPSLKTATRKARDSSSTKPAPLKLSSLINENCTNRNKKNKI